jgi:hypothetical protein
MRTYMRAAIAAMSVVVLASALPAWAFSKGSGGGSQAGGLPAVEKQVDALQAEVTTLQGQNNWAVVEPSATTNPVESFSAAGPVTAEHVGTGEWEVTFSKDVSRCAYEATIGDPGNAATEPTLPLATGTISVAGDIDADSPDDVTVNTFVSGTLTDLPFHLLVVCP